MIDWNIPLKLGLTLLSCAILGGIWGIVLTVFKKTVSTRMLMIVAGMFLFSMLITLFSQIKVIATL